MHGHAGILPEFPGKLAFADIHGVNVVRTALEKAIGKATGGSADVYAEFTGGINLKCIERGFEFVATATDKFLAGGDLHIGISDDGIAGFAGELTVHADSTGENQALCLLPAGGQTTGDQLNIKPGAHRR